jgi:iron complex outermembrane recepter protein
VRLNKDWSFGTLKVGGLIEGSQTQRHNEFIDLSLGGVPDNKFKPPKYPFTSNAKLLENSDWFQGQIFADFYWHPISNLTIAPGFKYVNFTREVDAAHENVGGGSKNQSINASNTYSSPLYFLTANYKIRPDWSVYGQYATSFLIPSLSSLYVVDVNLQSLKPETTTNYQFGTVYTHGRITADADVYEIDASNLYNPCTISNGVNNGAYCNFGKARYSGVEGEAAYALDFGLTLFANGSLNSAKQLANAADPAAGINANPAQRLANSPKWTAAAGVLYSHRQWNASLTYKQVGDYVAYGATTFRLPAYDTLNGSLGYDFGRFGLKLQVQNLLDRRQITSFVPGSSKTLYDPTDTAALYTFQAGRELSLTLIGKF